jgi:hypothetical protein
MSTNLKTVPVDHELPYQVCALQRAMVSGGVLAQLLSNR